MFADVEPDLLFVRADAQTDRAAQHLRDHEGKHEREDRGGQHAAQLHPQLVRIAVEQAVGAGGDGVVQALQATSGQRTNKGI